MTSLILNNWAQAYRAVAESLMQEKNKIMSLDFLNRLIPIIKAVNQDPVVQS